jgi:hypothetical protein
VPLVPATDAALPAARVLGRGRLLALDHGTSELMLAARLLARGVGVRWALEGFTEAGRSFPAGTLLVPASARSRLLGEGRGSAVVAHAVRTRRPPASLRLRLPRVGLYRSWVPSLDEGWTRFVFEKQLGLPYQTLHDRELRQGSLRTRFDAIVLPSQSPLALREGHKPGTMPAEYTGGLGSPGQAALREFVETGGTLVALDASAVYAIEALGLTVRNVLGGVAASEFFCPGSILEVQTDPAVPLAHGLPPALPIWFEGSPAFEVQGGLVAARYGEGDSLLSGYLLGNSRLRGRAALVEMPLGKGRVVLFGFRPQHRGQAVGTFKLLFNAICLQSRSRVRPYH